MKFQNNVKSYLTAIGLGAAAGLLTTVLNLFPYDTLWSFSSIASAFGFWIITTTLVIYASCSNVNAAVNTFLYLGTMNLVFYSMQGVLGLFLPRFYSVDSFINWGLLKRFTLLALLCAAVAFVLYYWNRDSKFSSFLYALPLCGLVAELIGACVFLWQTHTYLFQLLMDAAGLAFLLSRFWKKAASKPLLLATAAVGGAAGAYLFYLPNLL
ncbi:MAG: hypothetical protein Q4C72_09080 [Eubacteriales bacterium]|nr:hypothetical protein [Eubacteriales bacterium]